jgi:hypothetical protein
VLGLGQGQILVTPADLPWRFRAALGRAARLWSQQGVELEYPFGGEPPDELFAVIADNLDGDEGGELGQLAGLIAVARKLVEEAIADPARAGSEFVFALGFEDGEVSAQRYGAAEGSPHLGMVVEDLDRRGGPWVLVASPGPDQDATQLLVMAAGCSAHEPLAGLTTITADTIPLVDSGWKFSAASDLFEQIGAL